MKSSPQKNLLGMLIKSLLSLGIFLSAVIFLATIIYVTHYGWRLPHWEDGAWWVLFKKDKSILSPSMRVALEDSPIAKAGTMQWEKVDEGFETGILPVLVGSKEVDQLYLARIDSARFRFGVYNSQAVYSNLDGWMKKLGAVLVVNGSYFAKDHRPDTPFLSEGKLLGPKRYDARGGAFVSSDAQTAIKDLSKEDWQKAFEGEQNAMVSYPLLLAQDGSTRVGKRSHWLANRSFVGQDREGWIVIGTTKDAFFSLERLADFLKGCPLDLALVLNLDGGPVACQGISLNGFHRKTYGKWEARVENDEGKLLVCVPRVPASMPVVLAVFSKDK